MRLQTQHLLKRWLKTIGVVNSGPGNYVVVARRRALTQIIGVGSPRNWNFHVAFAGVEIHIRSGPCIA